MSNIVKKEITWCGRKLTIETGKIANAADGSVVITYGETVVLCTVVAQKYAKENCDFFPLTVHYREMAFAAGKIPGGYHKREGRSSDREVLTSRLIDRPIRPLFPENFHNETQIICTLLSHDLENDSDIISIIGASAALAISGLPFSNIIAAATIMINSDEQLICNPTMKELRASQLNLVVAGTKESILMIESEAQEISENQMISAIELAKKEWQIVIEMIEELAHIVNKPKWHIDSITFPKLEANIAQFMKDNLIEIYQIKEKRIRRERLDEIKKQTVSNFTTEEHSSIIISHIIHKVEKNIFRDIINNNSIRIDGREFNEIRKISTEVGLLPKTHGSSLFTRGETQALVVTTLGTSQDEQLIDNLDGDIRESFMLHYNFLPYSVGEATQLKAPGRREIGHGRLAWRAMQSVLPKKSEFPYTIRLVSEITACNGSSSMATVCGSTLSLMDAGVPIRAAVAGIAMGLVKTDDSFIILSDISGDEDHLGDMDFKVAGTNDGITALQMDMKISGINIDTIKKALIQAKEGRLSILSNMTSVMCEPRKDLNANAPSITTINISKDKIREVIGAGGSVIKKICEVSGAKVDIEDNGTVKIVSSNSKSSEIAVKMIEDIVLEPEIGKIYEGKVVKIVEFGAFVNFLGSRDGLIHISELAEGRVEQVIDYVNLGDKVKVIVLGIDNRGKIKLSLRLVDQETGEVLGQGNVSVLTPETQPTDNERRKRSTRSQPIDKNNRAEKRKYYN